MPRRVASSRSQKSRFGSSGCGTVRPGSVTLESDLCVREWPGKSDVRLTHSNPDSLDEGKLERPLGDPLADFLEKAGVAACYYLRNEFVDATIVHDVPGGGTLASAPYPER